MRKPKTNHHFLLGALVLGAILGTFAHQFNHLPWIQPLWTYGLQPIGQIFLRLIFMVVVPMVFAALVLGVYELGQSRGLGRVAAKTLFFTLLASSSAVLIGVFLVAFFQPGKGFVIPALPESATAGIQKSAAQAKSAIQAIVELVPKNPLESAVLAFQGEILSLMVFSLIFGVALSQVSQGKRGGLVEVLEQILETCMRIIHSVMRISPIAVFALVFGSAYQLGPEVFRSLLGYAAVVLVGLGIQLFAVYPLLLKTFTRRAPLRFFAQLRDVMAVAFSTASSNATLPRSLEVAEHELKLCPRISRFVLTIGATANQNGTALFEGVTVLFLAQVYGVDLSFGQQFQVVVMSIIAGIGTAGVPGGSLPLIVLVLQSVGIPAEGIGLVLGVDRFLDMCRTTLNVTGDMVIAALVDETREGDKKLALG